MRNSLKRAGSNALSSDTKDFNELLDIINKVNPDDFRKNKSSSLIRQQYSATPFSNTDKETRCSKMHAHPEDKSKNFYKLD